MTLLRSLEAGWCRCSKPLDTGKPRCGSCGRPILSERDELLVSGQIRVAAEMSRLATAVAELVAQLREPAEAPRDPGSALSVKEAGLLLGYSPAHMRRHHKRYGGFRPSGKPQGHIRFSRPHIEGIASGEIAPLAAEPRRATSRRRKPKRTDLLPVDEAA